MTAIRIGEDEAGLRNLYPLAERAAAEAATRAAEAAWVTDRATGGAGWTEAHIRRRPVRAFEGLSVDLGACVAAAAAHLPRIRDFGVGDDPRDPAYRREPDAHCYGFGDEVFVKFEHDDGRLLGIWFDAMTGRDEWLRVLRRALEAIDAVAPSVVADDWLEAVGALGDRAFMNRYFVALGLERT